jgi:hypothetical protein
MEHTSAVSKANGGRQPTGFFSLQFLPLCGKHLQSGWVKNFGRPLAMNERVIFDSALEPSG